MSGFIAVTWLVFWAYWIVSAVRTGPHGYRKTLWWYRVIVLIAAIVAVRLSHAHSFGPDDFIVRNEAIKVIGLVIFLAGLGLAVWARVYLGNSWGMPMTQPDKPRLVTSGPYRYVRHPIYSGLLLGLAGTALAIDWLWLIVLVLAGGYFIFSAVKEEEFMTKQLPAAYRKYHARTKMLVPFVF